MDAIAKVMVSNVKKTTSIAIENVSQTEETSIVVLKITTVGQKRDSPTSKTAAASGEIEPPKRTMDCTRETDTVEAIKFH